MAGPSGAAILVVNDCAHAFVLACVACDRCRARHVLTQRRRVARLPPQPARALATLDALPVSPDTLYAVDEAQFFGPDLLHLADRVLAARGATLALSGLDLDFAGAPFGHVLELAVRALAGTAGTGGSRGGEDVRAADGGRQARVTALTAVCTHRGGGGGGECGEPAAYSQRLERGGGGRVRVGGSEFYAPACARHHVRSPVPAAEWGAGAEGVPRPGARGAGAGAISAGVAAHSWSAAARSPSLEELLVVMQGGAVLPRAARQGSSGDGVS
jgi:thymidine kinase